MARITLTIKWDFHFELLEQLSCVQYSSIKVLCVHLQRRQIEQSGKINFIRGTIGFQLDMFHDHSISQPLASGKHPRTHGQGCTFVLVCSRTHKWTLGQDNRVSLMTSFFIKPQCIIILTACVTQTSAV